MTAHTHTPRALTMASPDRQSVILAVFYMIAACLIVVTHSVLVAVGGVYGLAWIVSLTVATMLLAIELSFALTMVFLFLQNALAAVIIPLIQDQSRFQILLGSGALNILISAVMCGFLWLHWRRTMQPGNRQLLMWLGLFLVAIAFYTGVGAAFSTLSSAIVYARIYLIGVFLLVIGAAMGLRITFDYVVNIVRVLAVILVCWGIVEICFTFDLYTFFNIKTYINFKYIDINYVDSFSSVSDLVQSYTRPYLNLSGQYGINISILRPMGPNIHPISYGYALTFCCLMCFISRRYVLTGACFVIAALVGAKGPLLMIVASVLLSLQYESTLNRRWLALALLTIMIVYSVGGIAYGLATDDYHMLGLLGAIKGFFSNPLGHGIGVGGSLSALGMQDTNFDEFQNLGSADFALESAIGVMIYQLGVASIIFFVFYWHLWKNVWHAALFFSAEPRLVVIPVALGLLLINAIFQEEAFSPLGWGPWLLVGGMIMIMHWRESGRLRERDGHAATLDDAQTSRIY